MDAPEKAVPIPADVWALIERLRSMGQDIRSWGPAYRDRARADMLRAAALLADRASQEERIREDEREAIVDLIASWPEIGGYTGDLRQSILSTVLDRDAAIIQAIRERGVS